ncbi:MAG: DUF3418 domain-containing protein [Spirochaetota bacterium]
MSLFGLIIEPGRPRRYGPIDPEGAFEIFIREALIAGRVKTELPFMSQNRERIDTVRDMENRFRRRDLFRFGLLGHHFGRRLVVGKRHEDRLILRIGRSIESDDREDHHEHRVQNQRDADADEETISIVLDHGRPTLSSSVRSAIPR